MLCEINVMTQNDGISGNYRGLTSKTAKIKNNIIFSDVTTFHINVTVKKESVSRKPTLDA